MGFNGTYPLVNFQITNWKDPPFYSWLNPLFLCSWSIANCNSYYQRVSILTIVMITVERHHVDLNDLNIASKSTLKAMPFVAPMLVGLQDEAVIPCCFFKDAEESDAQRYSTMPGLGLSWANIGKSGSLHGSIYGSKMVQTDQMIRSNPLAIQPEPLAKTSFFDQMVITCIL